MTIYMASACSRLYKNIFKTNDSHDITQSGDPYNQTLKKAKKIAYNVFLVLLLPLGLYRVGKYAMHRLIGLIVVQSQMLSRPLRKAGNRNYFINCLKSECEKDLYDKVEEVTIKTADNINLNAMVFKAKEPKGTIIFFGGTAYCYEGIIDYEGNFPLNPEEKFPLNYSYNHDLDTSLLTQASKAGFNLILFNTRGTGLSEGWASEEGLQKDAEAVVKYANETLNTEKENIVAYGHSLGGGIVAKLTENTIIIDGSFTKVSDAIKYMLGNGILGKIASFITKFFGWEMNSSENWKHIKGKKAILWRKHDYCVREDCSIKKDYENTTDEDKIFILKNSHHMSPLSDIEFNSIFLSLFPNFQPIATKKF